MNADSSHDLLDQAPAEVYRDLADSLEVSAFHLWWAGTFGDQSIYTREERDRLFGYGQALRDNPGRSKSGAAATAPLKPRRRIFRLRLSSWTIATFSIEEEM